MVKRLDDALEAEGRERGSLNIVVGTTLDPVQPAELAEYADAGVDEMLIPYVRQSHKWLQTYLESLSPFVEAARAA